MFVANEIDFAKSKPLRCVAHIDSGTVVQCCKLVIDELRSLKRMLYV